MAPTEGQTTHRVLLVDDDDAVRDMMSESLKFKGFEVVAVGGVTDALKCIATEKFDVLITDLHMPNAGDGFTVISAMRHSQPASRIDDAVERLSRREKCDGSDHSGG